MGNFIEDIIDADLKSGKVKKIAVRFPPEPNGFLHIGHAKTICLNSSLAKKYGGVFNLRFDDTNPAKEDIEYVDKIIDDVKWLAKPTNILYASDYFDKKHEIAIKLIKKGLAYVCNLTPDEIKAQRGTLTTKGVESKYRNRSAGENLKLFADMKNGKFKDGEAVLRAKIDMSSPNVNMRDPILYRVLHMHHYRSGDKWCIYPMYDFAHTIQDAIEKISHSCCSLEFENHRPLYDWVAIHGEFDPRPHQYEFARLAIKGTVLSKRYLNRLVEEGHVNGWDDPRMPTLAGLRRRGYTSSSIHEFCTRTGVARANSEVDPSQLEACIREELNTTAHRAMAVLDPLELEIINRDAKFNEKLNFSYPLNGEEFIREISFSAKLYIEREDFLPETKDGFIRLVKGGYVRLKGAYIIRCDNFELNVDGSVKKVYASIIDGTKSGEPQDPNAPKAKGVIHWVDAKTCVKIKANLYDHLLLDDENEQDLFKRLNPNSLVVKQAFAEPFVKKAKKGQSFQFLRLAYFVRDSIEADLIFNRTVGLKDNSKKKV